MMEVIDDVLSVNEAFYDAFGAADVPAMSSIWAAEATVTCLHPGWAPLHGREAVLSSWQEIMESPSRPRIECVQSSAEIYGETAIVLCYESLQGGFLLATNIFVKEDGAWRMIHHHAGGPVADPA
jgi:ketosteroid isomerase-like protein